MNPYDDNGFNNPFAAGDKLIKKAVGAVAKEVKKEFIDNPTGVARNEAMRKFRGGPSRPRPKPGKQFGFGPVKDKSDHLNIDRVTGSGDVHTIKNPTASHYAPPRKTSSGNKKYFWDNDRTFPTSSANPGENNSNSNNNNNNNTNGGTPGNNNTGGANGGTPGNNNTGGEEIKRPSKMAEIANLSKDVQNMFEREKIQRKDLSAEFDPMKTQDQRELIQQANAKYYHDVNWKNARY